MIEVSKNPSDWVFALFPKEEWIEGPTAFLNPATSGGEFDQECHEYLVDVFDALKASGLEGYEAAECHITIKKEATVVDLRNFLLGQGLKKVSLSSLGLD